MFEDIRIKIPKDPVAAIIFLGDHFETIWPRHAGNRNIILGLDLENLDQNTIQDISYSLKIIISAHSRINSDIDIPEEIIRPFKNETMSLPPTCHTFLTKLMPLEARMFASTISERTDVDFFDDVEPEASFHINSEDRSKILSLINEIRKIIFDSAYISENHKRRLIKRLNIIESETYKPVGLYDKIIAGAKEFFDFAEYAGNKSKPIIDRYKEIKEITDSKLSDYDAIEAQEEPKRLPPPDEPHPEDDDIADV